MSDRISKVALSQPVTSYSSGAAQDATKVLEVANFLAPTVNCTLPNFTYMVYNDQNRFRIPDAARAVGGRATQVNTGGVSTAGVLKPYALDYDIDEFESAGENLSDEQIQGIFFDAADTCAQLGALSWADKVIGAALTSVGSGTDQNSNTTTLDLIDAIDTQIVAVSKASGCGELCPVKIIIGPTAMRRLKNHTLTRGRFPGGGKGTSKGVNPSDEDVMSLFIGNPKIKISWITYDSADEGATAARTFRLDDQVLIFASADAPTRHSPDFMKTFRLRNMWMKPGRYNREDGRGTVFKMDWYALPVIGNSSAAARINITAT